MATFSVLGLNSLAGRRQIHSLPSCPKCGAALVEGVLNQSGLEPCPGCQSLLQVEVFPALFRRTATEQYQRNLLFSSVVDLMQAVVLGAEPSVFAAFRKRRHKLPVSDDSVYNKLKGMELGVSAALVRDSAERAAAVVDELQTRRAPWLPGYRTRILDGNHLSATEHRLKPLRDTWAAPLPGKILVVMDPELDLACDAFLDDSS